MATLNQQIEDLINGPMAGQGWCTVAKAHDLSLAVLKSKSFVTVEIGVFYGRSLIPMAMAHKKQDHGIVWAIDPYSPVESVKGQNEVNSDWWTNKVDHENVYQTFLRNIDANGVRDFVRVIRRPSDEVIPPHEISVLHVDGNHSDQAIRDVERFASKVVMNGFCFMDDLQWHPGIMTAVGVLEGMGFVKLFDRDTGAMFERRSKRSKTAIPKNKKALLK